MYDKLIGKNFKYNGNIITITKFIAAGGNSVVYECNYLKKNYVIKYFKGTKIKRYKRFISEVKKIKIINERIENCTPPIIETYLPSCDMRKTRKINLSKSPFYIMKKAEAFAYNTLNFEDKINKIIEFSLKLREMHSFGFIHRDIKPENIVYYNGNLSLIDYGTSHIPGVDTIDGEETMGSIGTMAPEMVNRHVLGEQDDIYSDIYSLGKTIWIILTNDRKAYKFTTYDCNALNSKIMVDDINSGIIMELEQIIQEATKENYLERISLDDLIKRLVVIKEKLINNYDNCNINKFKCILRQFSNYKYDSVNISDNNKILKFIPQLNLVGLKISIIDTGINICDSLENTSFILLYDAKIKMYYFELNNTRFIFDIYNININDRNIIIETKKLRNITDDDYIRLNDIDSFSRMSVLTNINDLENKRIYIESEIYLEPIEFK